MSNNIFEIDIPDFNSQVDQYLDYINNKSESLMKKISIDAKNEVQKRFRNASDGDGKPWQELSESTINQRRKNSSKPLNDTGEGRNSWTNFYSKDEAGAGTPLKKLEIHDTGGVIKKSAGRKTMYFKRNRLNDKLRMSRKSKSDFAFDVDVKAHDIIIPQRNMTKMSTKQIERYTKWVAQFMSGKIFNF